MKIVKLRKNQKLFKDGYTHAFRFTSWGVDTGKVIAALNKVYNNRQWRGKYWAWQVETGNWHRNRDDRWERYVYVAVRSEAITTQVLLIKD